MLSTRFDDGDDDDKLWHKIRHTVAQSAGAAEYTDCISNECPGYDTKQSHGEAPVILEI